MARPDVAEGQTVDPEIRHNLLEPFIAATSAALGEMAGAEMFVQSVYQQATLNCLDDLSAVVEIMSATGGFMVLSFPQGTAAAFAARILAGVTEEIDDNLLGDCVGEMATVIAGQAKALLAGGPYQFTFSIPKVLAEVSDYQPPQAMNCLVIVFRSEQGHFTLQVLRDGV